MACPYFFPLSLIENTGFTIPPRLPLGEAYSGECRADAVPHVPSEPLLGRACNPGYGRAACHRFPSDAAADAVRFHVSDTAERSIRVQFVLEKDCWPAAHGVLIYSEPDGRFLEPHQNPVIQRQAEVFLDSYQRRAQA